MPSGQLILEEYGCSGHTGKLEKELRQSEKLGLSSCNLIQDLQASLNFANSTKKYLEDVYKNLLAESEELERQLEILRKQLGDKLQLEEMHRKCQVEMMTTAREMERACKSRLQEQLQAMRAGFDACLNESRCDIDEKYKNKLDEANETLQQMNQAQEETARMRLRVHELEKAGSGYESRIEALNRKISDFESQLRLTRDDYDLRLSQRDKRVVELQEEIGRLLNENQDKFDLGVQLNTELKACRNLLERVKSLHHIYCFSGIFLINFLLQIKENSC
ncbi:unnamed protein product [Gongylonema pulchrum]|uniref:IF rod domain-containing protein n=1 Tax=Gongylonema pulchrum TaxID=637853 RepID=A0A183E626_9BILA|nr:unnamed protein product [Gongylonema pulchrum]